MNNPLIAILSDIHFGQSNFNKEIFETQMEFFEKQFFPYLIENNIKDVIHCGDFFHNRNLINWLIYNELKTRFFKWFDDNDVKFHTVLGNHDLFYRSTLEVNSLTETIKEFNNILVYDKDTIVTIGKYTLGMIPWIIDRKNYKFPSKCDMLFAHLELNGFPMTKGISSKEGYETTTFSKYKYVFSGHYHTNFTKDNVIMVGSPYQTTWNDFNELKGFYVVDDNFHIEYVKNIINPRFVKVYYDDEEISISGLYGDRYISNEEAIVVAKENYVRLFVKKASNQLKLENFHTSLSLVSKNSYKIDIVNTLDIVDDSNLFDDSFDSDEDTIDIIISCIEGMTFDDSIDKDLLIKLSKVLYKEATDEALSL